MKLFTAIATTALLLAAPAVNAGETWVRVTDDYSKTVTPGTLADEFGWHGTAFYIDLQSIVTKGDITYYNDSWIALDAFNQPHRSMAEDNWDFEENQPRRRNARKVKCATSMTFKPSENAFVPAKRIDLEILRMVCK